MTRVKICGNTNVQDAKLAVSLGADYLGFIFTESKRRIDPAMASEIIGNISGFKNFVGVFCNQPKTEVKRIASKLGLKILQFHGDETARYCQYFINEGFEVIKTFHIKDAMSLKRIDEYNVTSYLFDTYSKDAKGGTGIPFDWKLIGDRPFVHEKLFIAGGLNIQNVAEVIDKIHPFAVDVASGVEKSPGQKDPQLLEQFIHLAKGEKKRLHA
ncbi:MAG: phosphoribosylanthranilate isomerase [Candidatus Omnitrophica bacterium]|nr:phosphoribosylanthranilate isomerase [Candidatus Omnitrophota bacterium]